MTPKLSLQYCPVTVDDMDAAVEFYSGTLGLPIAADIANDGHRWVQLDVPGQQDVRLVLSEPGGGRSEQDAQALHRLLAKGLLPNLVFSTPDLDATFERLVAAKADILQEPTDQFWGARDCAVRDPAGNMIKIAQA